MNKNSATNQVNDAIEKSLDVLLSMTGLLNELDFERDKASDNYYKASMLYGVHSKLLSVLHDVQFCSDLMLYGMPSDRKETE